MRVMNEILMSLRTFVTLMHTRCNDPEVGFQRPKIHIRHKGCKGRTVRPIDFLSQFRFKKTPQFV